MTDLARLPNGINLAAYVRHAMRTDLVSFTRRSFNELVPGTDFASNWHIEAMAYHLEEVRRGAIRRLIITMPPRSLKSIMASVAFPAFIHGHDPAKSIICVSYSHDLAAKHQNDYRAILRSPWFREAFPGTCIDPMKDNEGETLLNNRGVRLATSAADSRPVATEEINVPTSRMASIGNHKNSVDVEGVPSITEARPTMVFWLGSVAVCKNGSVPITSPSVVSLQT